MNTLQKPFDLQSDAKLALSVIVLWSLGRIINPLRYIAETNNQQIGGLLMAATVVYVLLHIGIFIYCGVLIMRALRSRARRNPWELVLYAYVLIALLVSFSFILFELGFLPAAVVDYLTGIIAR